MEPRHVLSKDTFGIGLYLDRPPPWSTGVIGFFKAPTRVLWAPRDIKSRGGVDIGVGLAPGIRRVADMFRYLGPDVWDFLTCY